MFNTITVQTAAENASVYTLFFTILFASLAGGISCGAYAFPVAAILLYYSPLGPISYFDGMVRFNIEFDNQKQKKLDALMHEYEYRK